MTKRYENTRQSVMHSLEVSGRRKNTTVTEFSQRAVLSDDWRRNENVAIKHQTWRTTWSEAAWRKTAHNDLDMHENQQGIAWLQAANWRRP